MKRKLIVSSVVLSSVLSISPLWGANKHIAPPAASFHKSENGGAAAPTNPTAYNMIEVIKRVPINGYPSATIGAAFDKYPFFEKKEWTETLIKGGKVYVNFRGYLKKGFFDWKLFRNKIENQGVEVKFAVFPSGEYEVAMVSKLTILTNGNLNIEPAVNSKELFENILRNKEIKF